MNHYWVRMQSSWTDQRVTHYIDAPNEKEAVETALETYPDGKLISVRVDHNYGTRQYWGEAWDRALKGLIAPNGGRGWGHLARLLGYKMYSTPGNRYIGHTQSYNNWLRGSKPKNPWQAARLLELADMY